MHQKPWLNYHHLYYFKTIATEGNLSKAAQKLRLGQPTLSTQMKQFEEILGYSLFDRSKRSLQLTEAGRAALTYAQEIFRLGDEMLDSLGDQHVGAKLQIQIGVSDSVAKSISMKLVHAAKKLNDCVVSISEGHGDELLRELRAHRLDLILSNFPPPVGDAAGFFSRSISKMPICVCGSKKYSGLKKNFPKSMNGHDFIMPHITSKLRQDLDHYLSLQQIRVQTVAEIQDSSLKKLLALNGDGLIAVPAIAVKDLVDKGELVMLGFLEDVYEELWLTAAKRQRQNSIAAELMKSLKF